MASSAPSFILQPQLAAITRILHEDAKDSFQVQLLRMASVVAIESMAPHKSPVVSLAVLLIKGVALLA